MPTDIFPFELDGVVVVSETEIEHEGQIWRAAVGEPIGQWTLRPDWLRSGAKVEAPSEGELWESEGRTLPPSVGPAWEGVPYIPTPGYVREQVLRRRAGLPPRELAWVRSEPPAPNYSETEPPVSS
jgi:hypothetical protein